MGLGEYSLRQRLVIESWDKWVKEKEQKWKYQCTRCREILYSDKFPCPMCESANKIVKRIGQ